MKYIIDVDGKKYETEHLEEVMSLIVDEIYREEFNEIRIRLKEEKDGNRKTI